MSGEGKLRRRNIFNNTHHVLPRHQRLESRTAKRWNYVG